MTSITSIAFKDYKTFRHFTVPFSKFNIIVGPNNAGKSTVIGSLKLLSEGLKKARLRNPILIRDIDDKQVYGYEIELKNAPIAIENVFFNYDDSVPAIISYSLSNECLIQIWFPEANVCFMKVESENFRIKTTKEFKKYIDLIIGFVPTLAPVDQNELLYQPETARLALTTFKASRNFRNIWHHLPEDFDAFKNLISTTWPGMDVKRPEIIYKNNQPTLNMYCPEDHIDREIFWAGYGFQIWCQMLTYVIKNKDATLFVIDEPDIYLHADLQRQLLGILKDLGPDIVIATHSTEIVTEADLNDILIINKIHPKAKRITNGSQLKVLFSVLGSNLNPIITQIAKSKRVLFLEGKDFMVLSRLAKILGYKELANRSDFAIFPVDGFNPDKVKACKEGIEEAIGSAVLSAVIFDRDYRSNNEVTEILTELKKGNSIAHIHSFKELENIALIPNAIGLAINQRINDYNKRTNNTILFDEDIEKMLSSLSDNYKAQVLAQLQAHRLNYEKAKGLGIDQSVIMTEVINEFDIKWTELYTRLKIVPGKEFISILNKHLQERYPINISLANIISNCSKSMLSEEVIDLLKSLNNFRKLPTA